MTTTMEPTVQLKPETVQWGDVPISRFILGSNPFGGFAHQAAGRDDEMRDWYTMERVKECYRLAQEAGVTATVARADEFLMRAMREFRNEGGDLTIIGQTCPGVGTFDHGINNVLGQSAKACFLHGGEMDYRLESDDTKGIFEAIARIRGEGMLAGIAGHTTDVIRWGLDNLELDFCMTCYYNPDDRRKQAHRNYDVPEYYGPEHREAMCALIQEMPIPAIHYKVLAAGRHNPREAFEFVADAYRPGDAVCVGIFTKEGRDMIQENINLLETALRARGK
jgi:hypothetical protein